MEPLAPLLFDVLKDDPTVGLFVGDRLAVDFRRARMWTADRIIPANYGHLAGLIADDALAWLTPSQSVQEAIPVPPFPLRVVA